MSTVPADRRYARAAGALWRDTGAHVLVLPDLRNADVVVLGGGNAVLWRLLDHPLARDEIEAELGRHGEGGPDPEVIGTCLDELVACRVLAPPKGER